MLRNFIYISSRRFLRNKLISVIKLVSLSAGILCFIFIAIYVNHELNFDRFNKNANRIVRVITEFSVNGSVTRWVVGGTRVGPQLQRTFPQVKSYVRMIRGSRVVRYHDALYDETNFLFADSTFLKIFTFPLIEGNELTALDGPNKVILTQSMAKKYFGNEDPLGKMLVIGGDQDYLVTGLMKDVPGNSQITFDFLTSFSNLEASKTEDWYPANYTNYLLLEKGVNVPELARQIDKYARDESQKDPDLGGLDYFTFHLEPLTYVHLHSDIEAMVPNIPAVYIYILMLIAFLILTIAGINYANLTIAQVAEQKTEIGIRKVLGALKRHLIRQFIGESMLLTAISAAVAIVLAVSLLPYFNVLSGRLFDTTSVFQPVIAVTIIILCIILSFFTGAYPALVLSGHRLVNILKPGYRLTATGGGFRKLLITFQFMISVVLIITTLVIRQQRSYIQQKNIGYNKDNVIYIRMDQQAFKHYYDLKAVLKQYPDIQDVTAAYTTPTVITWTNTLTVTTDNGEKQFSTREAPVDLDYIRTLGIHLIAGSDFTEADLQALNNPENSGNHKASFLLNETAVRDIGWTPEEAVGRQLNAGPDGIVKGVISDFNLASLHEPIRPLVIFLDNNFLHVLMIRLRGNDMRQTLSYIEKNWKIMNPLKPFDYHFLNEEYDAMYQSEQKTAQLFGTFSSIAILLACLGLFGMTALITVRRTREIGIRKVLGASVGNITVLLSGDFLKLVLLAFAIASPVAWYASERWLQNFVFRIKIPVWIFIAAGAFAAVITMATVSYQSIRAALTNPANSLRNE